MLLSGVWYRGWDATGLVRAYDPQFQLEAMERHATSGDLFPEGEAPTYEGEFNDPQPGEVEPLFTGIGDDGDDRPKPLAHNEEPPEDASDTEEQPAINIDTAATEEEMQEAGELVTGAPQRDEIMTVESDERALSAMGQQAIHQAQQSRRGRGRGGGAKKPLSKTKLTPEELAMVGRTWVEWGPDSGDIPVACYRIVAVAWYRPMQQKVAWYYNEADPRFTDGFPTHDDPKKRYAAIRRLCDNHPVVEVKEWLDVSSAISGGGGVEEEKQREVEEVEQEEEDEEVSNGINDDDEEEEEGDEGEEQEEEEEEEDDNEEEEEDDLEDLLGGMKSIVIAPGSFLEL